MIKMMVQNYGSSSGISFCGEYALMKTLKAKSLAAEGKAYNSIYHHYFTYELNGNIKVMWMGDMEHAVARKPKDRARMVEVDVLFAPTSWSGVGKVSDSILKKLKSPHIVVIGAGTVLDASKLLPRMLVLLLSKIALGSYRV
ncbi:MAG: hypothetical protein ACLTSG_06395 [Lachnospiraceae bacterium]